MNLKTVLLATDLSSYTSTLLSHAADLANKHQSQLVVVHAVEPLGNIGHALMHAYLKPEQTQKMTTDGLDHLLENVKAQVIDSLADEHIEGLLDLKQLADVHVEIGPPAEVILQTATAVNADVIIMGSHAPESSISTQLGSVAQKVLGNSHIPVYFVPILPLPLPTSLDQQLPLW